MKYINDAFLQFVRGELNQIEVHLLVHLLSLFFAKLYSFDRQTLLLMNRVALLVRYVSDSLEQLRLIVSVLLDLFLLDLEESRLEGRDLCAECLDSRVEAFFVSKVVACRILFNLRQSAVPQVAETAQCCAAQKGRP